MHAVGRSGTPWAALEGVPRSVAQCRCDWAMVKLANESQLVCCAREGRADALAALLATPAGRAAVHERDRNMWCAFTHACDGGHVECARLLLAAGADVDASDRWGNTPLSLAATQGDVGMVRLLLGAGADVAVCDEAGVTPLMCACEHGHAGLVRELVCAGADVNRGDEFEETAMVHAVSNNHAGVARVLADLGARVDMATNRRNARMPIDFADERSTWESVLDECAMCFSLLSCADRRWSVDQMTRGHQRYGHGGAAREWASSEDEDE